MTSSGWYRIYSEEEDAAERSSSVLVNTTMVIFFLNSHWNQINGTTHCLNVSTGLTLKQKLYMDLFYGCINFIHLNIEVLHLPDDRFWIALGLAE